MVRDNEANEIWTAFQQGDREALATLYRTHIHALYNYGARITNDRDVLEDSIQDLFLTLWKQRASLSSVSTVRYYLYKGLQRAILDNLKKARKSLRYDAFLPHPFLEFVPAEDERIIEDEESTQRQQQLRRTIQTELTPRQREALTLLFCDNLPYSTVAELLSLTPKSTYKLVYRALDTLRAHLKNTVFAWLVLLSILAG